MSPAGAEPRRAGSGAERSGAERGGPMAFSAWQILSPVQWARWTWSAVRGGGSPEGEDGGAEEDPAAEGAAQGFRQVTRTHPGPFPRTHPFSFPRTRAGTRTHPAPAFPPAPRGLRTRPACPPAPRPSLPARCLASAWLPGDIRSMGRGAGAEAAAEPSRWPELPGGAGKMLAGASGLPSRAGPAAALWSGGAGCQRGHRVTTSLEVHGGCSGSSGRT